MAFKPEVRAFHVKRDRWNIPEEMEGPFRRAAIECLDDFETEPRGLVNEPSRAVVGSDAAESSIRVAETVKLHNSPTASDCSGRMMAEPHSE
jgi:hypothetical protein